MNTEILKKIEEIKAQHNNHIYPVDIAKILGMSEAELVHAQAGMNSIILDCKAEDILKDMTKVGKVLAITRNYACVLERKGAYPEGQYHNHGAVHMGALVSWDIDLRVFLNHWHHAYVVESNNRRSIQFYDEEGIAIHKIYEIEDTDKDAYNNLIRKYTAADQNTAFTPAGEKSCPEYVDETAIDWQAFEVDYAAMGDVHQYHPLLRKYKTDRLTSYRNMSDEWAYRVTHKSLRLCLERAAETQTPIMMFAGNHGCIQINTDTVHNIVKMGEWLNVLDEGNTAHIKHREITDVWVSKRPFKHKCEYVTCVDCFDKDGQIILTIFGKRREKTAELDAWRDIAFNLPRYEDK